MPPAARSLRLPTSPWLRGLAFAALYALAVVAGRATRLEGTSLALAWPAAAVGFCWLATAWGGRRRLLVSTFALFLVAATSLALTGTGPVLAAVYAVDGVAQAAVACTVLRRWQQRRSSVLWTLRRTTDLTGLVLASGAGGLAAATIGPLALHVVSGAPLGATAGAWLVRHSVSTFAFAAGALRLADRGLGPTFRDRRQVLQALAVGVAVIAAYAVVFSAHEAVVFVLLPLSLWIALRFDTTVSALHTVVIGAVVVVATREGWGPFTTESVAQRVLTAQAYVAVAGLVALVLALHRDERQQLVAESQHAHRRADEQAELLSSVLANMDEGVALFDTAGDFLVRNAAVEQLTGLRSGPDGRVALPEQFSLHSPSGRPVTSRQLAHTRALAGEQVDEDFVVRTGPGRERVLSVRGTPLSTAGGRPQALVIFTDVTAQRRTAREIAEARDLFSGVLDAASEFAIVSTDLDFRITVFNAGAERMLGYRADEVVGGDIMRLHSAEEVHARADELGLPVGPQMATGAALRGRPETRQWTFVRRDGSTLQVSLTVSAMRDRTGAVTGYMGLARDITAQLAAAADLADSEERFRLTFATAPIGMMLVELLPVPGRVLQVNAAMPALLGHAEEEMVGSLVTRFSHPEEVGEVGELLRRATTAAAGSGSSGSVQMERRYLHADGGTVWARISASVARPRRGQPHLICLVEDVTARRKAEEALTHQALHDPLTGLPNRALFGDRLEHALAAADRSRDRVGVLLLDLDGFKAVNDTAGHAAGDELLQTVSARLSGCVRPGDTVARLGGDEFAVVCPGIDAVDEAGAVSSLRVIGDRILETVGVPFDLRAGTFRVGVSVGLVAASAGTPQQQVVHAADEAMYAAKRGGKNQVSVAPRDSLSQVGAPGLPVRSGG